MKIRNEIIAPVAKIGNGWKRDKPEISSTTEGNFKPDKFEHIYRKLFDLKPIGPDEKRLVKSKILNATMTTGSRKNARINLYPCVSKYFESPECFFLNRKSGRPKGPDLFVDYFLDNIDGFS